MILSHMIYAVRAWRRYRVCVRELSLLSDRQLADIGVTRCNIAAVAWRNARDRLAVAKPMPRDSAS